MPITRNFTVGFHEEIFEQIKLLAEAKYSGNINHMLRLIVYEHLMREYPESIEIIAPVLLGE